MKKSKITFRLSTRCWVCGDDVLFYSEEGWTHCNGCGLEYIVSDRAGVAPAYQMAIKERIKRKEKENGDSKSGDDYFSEKIPFRGCAQAEQA